MAAADMKKKANAPESRRSSFESSRIPPTCSILDALRSMDKSGNGIALVVDDDERLLGTLTDGDIRRALMKSATLESVVAPFLSPKFISVFPGAGRAEVLDLMHARKIEQIPIVDEHGQLRGLHLLHELIGAVELPNTAVIMAGGQGMRLRPLTEHLPKPMLKVAGRPILERIVLHLVGCGIRHIYISVHYLGKIIEDYFEDGDRFGCRIEYLKEKEPLGTGGALSLLPEAPRCPLVVMNGDLITQANIPAMLDFHADGDYAATMAVRRYSHQVPFGCVELKEGRIVRLDEKPILEKAINAGIYVINPALLKKIPKQFFPITELFSACMSRGESVGAFEVEDEWIDVGQREQLKSGHA